MKIYEFQNEETAYACLHEINQLGADFFEAIGYTINYINGNPVCIGKDANTAEDIYSAKTTTWDNVKKSPDSTFYFVSISENRNISIEQSLQTTAQLKSVFGFTEKDFPLEWVKLESCN